MDKVAYRLKDTYASLKEKLTSPKAIRVYDKIAKVFRTVVPIFAIYAILITFSYIFMSPILRVLVDSFKLKDDLVNPDVVWIPTKLTFMNYLDAGKALWLYRVDTANDGAVVSTLFNSAFYSTLTAILQTLVSRQEHLFRLFLCPQDHLHALCPRLHRHAWRLRYLG